MIRTIHAARAATHRELAAHFGLSREGIRQIVGRRCWKGIEPTPQLIEEARKFAASRVHYPPPPIFEVPRHGISESTNVHVDGAARWAEERARLHSELRKLAALNELLRQQVRDLEQQLTSERNSKVAVGVMSGVAGFMGGVVLGSSYVGDDGRNGMTTCSPVNEATVVTRSLRRERMSAAVEAASRVQR